MDAGAEGGADGVVARGEVRPRPVMTPGTAWVGEEGDIKSAKPESVRCLRVRRAPFIVGGEALVEMGGHAEGGGGSGRGWRKWEGNGTGRGREGMFCLLEGCLVRLVVVREASRGFLVASRGVRWPGKAAVCVVSTRQSFGRFSIRFGRGCDTIGGLWSKLRRCIWKSRRGVRNLMDAPMAPRHGRCNQHRLRWVACGNAIAACICSIISSATATRRPVLCAEP